MTDEPGGFLTARSQRIRGVMKIPMRKYIKDIREKTSGMTGKEKGIYIWTYYWYHILGTFAIIALILIFGLHYGFGNKKPLFTCILVNQETEIWKEQELKEEFSKDIGLPADQIVISTDYTFSYGDVRIEGVNESSYEKFFFQWRNKEIDAVIMSESFYLYVREMGGAFRELDETMTEGFIPYMDGNVCTAVVLGNDSFIEKVNGKKNEKLLLAFPETGGHTETCEMFLKFLEMYCTRKL